MKGNRKFVNEEEAVSAVIGVILMVAITVAIAATVYVYVSGMLSPTGESAPSLAWSADDADDTFFHDSLSRAHARRDLIGEFVSSASSARTRPGITST